MAKLTVLTGENKGMRFPVHKQAYIGRSRQHSQRHKDYINLQDSDISRNHVRIFKEGKQYFIRDLNSSNGTYVNEEYLPPGEVFPLHNRYEIRIGSATILFTQNETAYETQAKEDSDPFDFMENHYPSNINLQVVQEQEPGLSMILNASDIIDGLQVVPDEQEATNLVLIRRLQAITKVSISLGAIREREELMETILDSVFEIYPTIERAFIVLAKKDSDTLIPLAVRTQDSSVPLNEISISRTIVDKVIKSGQSLLIVDAMQDEQYKSQESIANLSIRSVMCAPLLFKGEVLGMLQVDTAKQPQLFSQEDLEVLTGISAQIAISVKNSQLYEEIENLFEGFVSASVQAIEARDPVTAGHSFRVAKFTENLLIAIDRNTSPELKNINFTRDQLQEIRYAALLHDFGKVGVRESILTKEKKLHLHELERVKQRFKYARACLRLQGYRDLVESHCTNKFELDEFIVHRDKLEKDLAIESEQLDDYIATVIRSNEPSIEYSEIPEQLAEIAKYRFTDHQGHQIQLISNFEFSALELSRGSLSPEERLAIESHVSHTYMFLNLIPWTGHLSKIPNIAHAHHEKLDGSGYPLGLKTEDIPIQSKIMAIADIFDALTSADRPYKTSVSVEDALQTLQREVDNGKLDKDFFRVFLESKAYVN